MQKSVTCWFGQFIKAKQTSPPNIHRQSKRIAIIGAGIAGCSLAHAASQQGLSCTLFDSHSQVAAGASGHPIALMNGRLSAQHSANDHYYTNGALYTLRLIKDAHRQGADLNFNLCGLFHAAVNLKIEKKLLRLLEQRQLSDDCGRWVDRNEASELTGLPMQYAGLWLPWVAWIHPTPFCQYLVNSPNISLQLSTTVKSMRHIDPYVATTNQPR